MRVAVKVKNFTFCRNTATINFMLYDIEKTRQFDKWFKSLKNNQVKARIGLRFKMIARGHFGDYKQISRDIFELRFFFGPGYRVYYTIQNDKVVILLNGGDKSSQNKDIESAQSLANALEN